ncbi:uncharacterized protein BDZ99DRAFT_292861 [Mytilinidion resinicola]|uniref:Uncharacterized protein n=1 Tax=Mytilinidion resinicola TaxID=574789 RepID=A0A6A6YR44_9PEZI|nr:uncharacterized protein BDZ99DRAFT_292861 [Mytilinidion resinicola]KAF2810989.1 hypothetical protein BDZ99DRAFT_292861 [Mytilinidion resinicola]
MSGSLTSFRCCGREFINGHHLDFHHLVDCEIYHPRTRAEAEVREEEARHQRVEEYGQRQVDASRRAATVQLRAQQLQAGESTRRTLTRRRIQQFMRSVAQEAASRTRQAQDARQAAPVSIPTPRAESEDSAIPSPISFNDFRFTRMQPPNGQLLLVDTVRRRLVGQLDHTRGHFRIRWNRRAFLRTHARLNPRV